MQTRWTTLRMFLNALCARTPSQILSHFHVDTTSVSPVSRLYGKLMVLLLVLTFVKCPVCLSSVLTLQINNSLHAKVKDFTTSNGPLREIQKPDRESKPTPPTISCDHCIELPSVAIRTCLTCDASLCQAHAQLHQKRPVLREHTLVKVTEDPLYLKCREHHNELKLFCLEHKVPVCYLCILVG